MNLPVYAWRPRDVAWMAEDLRRQWLMNAFKVYQLEVRVTQQALHYDQKWVEERLGEAKAELTKAQAALESFSRHVAGVAGG